MIHLPGLQSALAAREQQRQQAIKDFAYLMMKIGLLLDAPHLLERVPMEHK
jgi:hypothetical protein